MPPVCFIMREQSAENRVQMNLSVLCDSACIGCADCVNNCPNGAIYMEEKHAVIDPELCENCNMCQYVCMRNVIREQSVPEYIYLQHAALESDALDENAESEEKGGNE